MLDLIHGRVFCYHARHEHTSLIAITTGILSGIWGWVAVSLGLLSSAGFLGCTAYFACPQGGLKGLAISAATLLSGVVWAMVIIYGSALAPHLEILGYA